MERFDELFGQLNTAAADPSLRGVALALMLAFVIGQLIAWVYVRTHSGLSYSRGFTQSLVVLAMIATVVMSVIGNNVAAAFGLIGALAIIRFRNVLKDTRDTCFVFLTLVIGMAIGSQRFALAIVSCVGLMLTLGWLFLNDFGARGRFDGHLSYQTDGGSTPTLSHLLARHCRARKAVTVHDTGDAAEFVYQIRLRDRGRGHEMLAELESLDGVRNATLVLRDDLAEL